MDIQPLVPRQKVPALSVSTVGGATWTLAEQQPENFTLLVFYRGLHCPVCRSYLRDLQAHLEAFEGLGVEVLALSSDTQERAEQTREEWKLGELTLAYGLELSAARQWGLYVSTSRGKTSTGVVEPDLFSEPALYLVKPDGTLYFGAVQTMPFARPHFDDVVGAVKFVLEKDYPARGEVTDLPELQSA